MCVCVFWVAEMVVGKMRRVIEIDGGDGVIEGEATHTHTRTDSEICLGCWQKCERDGGFRKRSSLQW